MLLLFFSLIIITLCYIGFDEDQLFLYDYVSKSSYAGYKIINASRDMKLMWTKYYEHYINSNEYHDTDIIIKADDDIVYIDVSKFHDFLLDLSPDSLTFPNIVNNDVGLAIQAMRDVDPTLKSIIDIYEHQGLNVTERMNTFMTDYTLPPCPLTSVECETAVGGTGLDKSSGALFTNGGFGQLIHQAFLQHPQAFAGPQTQTQMEHPRFVKIAQRISINFFATPIHYFRKVFQVYLDKYCCDDEGYVGRWPSISGDRHTIDMRLVVAHFAFRYQYEDTDMSRSLKQYAAVGELVSRYYLPE